MRKKLPKVDVSMYLESPDRYALRAGTSEGAPLCPYGNHYRWIGFDKEKQAYVRFTKGLFKKLIHLQTLRSYA